MPTIRDVAESAGIAPTSGSGVIADWSSASGEIRGHSSGISIPTWVVFREPRAPAPKGGYENLTLEARYEQSERTA